MCVVGSMFRNSAPGLKGPVHPVSRQPLGEVKPITQGLPVSPSCQHKAAEVPWARADTTMQSPRVKGGGSFWCHL